MLFLDEWQERTIKLQLSDADRDRIAEKGGKAGLTVAELHRRFSCHCCIYLCIKKTKKGILENAKCIC